MGVFDYYFRTASLEYLRSRKAHTVVIFVDGILSHSKKAFELNDRNGFFWDLLIDEQVFNKFDFALFSYGKIDVSYLLELDYPINNLIRISHELHGYISQYKNVLFIAHSQGGLLAKTYASQFYNCQGIHLVTLHTPHRNKSFSVMRFNGSQIWDNEACYQVPHIFCASINDNKIVKPDNAFLTGHDRKYLSNDKSKSHLGHSHLSSNPDIDLLKLYFEDILYFNNSGISRVFCNTAQTKHGNSLASSVIDIRYSRSSSKLKINDRFCKRTKIVDKPWCEILELGKILKNHMSEKVNSGGCNISINSIGCSVNFFTKYLTSYFYDDARIHIISLDCGGESKNASNDYICEWIYGSRYSETNPYKHLPFDVSDFKKGSLIEDEDFLKVYIELLNDHGFTIKRTFEEGSYKRLIKEYYCLAAMKVRRNIVSNIYSECFKEKAIGIERFESVIVSIVESIKKLPERKNEYRVIYKIVKMEFEGSGQVIDIKGVEVVVSKLMRSDGDMYWLDRYWEQVFDSRSLQNAII